MYYANPEYDKLFNKAQNELANDPAAYAEAMLDAEKILLAEDFALDQYTNVVSMFLKIPYVKGIIYNRFGGDYSYKWVTVE